MYALDWLRLALRKHAPGAPVFEVYRDHGGQWRWRERNGGQTSGGGGEDFYSKWNAKRAAYAHAARIPGATVRVLEPINVELDSML